MGGVGCWGGADGRIAVASVIAVAGVACSGGAVSPVAAPTAPTPAIGFLGNPHAPHDIKPQETAFGYDALVTQEALTNAQSLFNCLGIPVTTTLYYPPKPKTAP
jgi:hypothetical protein